MSCPDLILGFFLLSVLVICLSETDALPKESKGYLVDLFTIHYTNDIGMGLIGEFADREAAKVLKGFCQGRFGQPKIG